MRAFPIIIFNLVLLAAASSLSLSSAQVPPAVPAPAVYLSAASCAAGQAVTTWADEAASPAGPATVVAGTALCASSQSRFGKAMQAVKVNTATGLELPYLFPAGQAYTVTIVDRYTTGARGRVLQGAATYGRNWLCGKWQNNNGAHVQSTGWLFRQQVTDGHFDMSTLRIDAAAGGTYWFNGQERARDARFVPASHNPGQLAIGTTGVWNERSDAEVALIIVWARGLTDAEVEAVHQHYNNAWGLWSVPVQDWTCAGSGPAGTTAHACPSNTLAVPDPGAVQCCPTDCRSDACCPAGCTDDVCCLGLTTTCASSTCTTARTCLSWPCAAGLQQVAGAATRACTGTGGSCDDGQCCEGGLYCASYTGCPAGRPLLAGAASLACDAVARTCSDARCCTQTCASYSCERPGLIPRPDPAGIVCPGEPSVCSDAVCCALPVHCHDVGYGSTRQCTPGPVTGLAARTAAAAVAQAGCAQASEGQALTLTCPPGELIASIDFASYGTASLIATTNYVSRCEPTLGACHAPDSLAVVEALCLGNVPSCTIPINNGAFGGDPCGNVPKYLAVQYTCLPPLPVCGIAATDCDDAVCCTFPTCDAFPCPAPDWTAKAGQSSIAPCPGGCSTVDCCDGVGVTCGDGPYVCENGGTTIASAYCGQTASSCSMFKCCDPPFPYCTSGPFDCSAASSGMMVLAPGAATTICTGGTCSAALCCAARPTTGDPTDPTGGAGGVLGADGNVTLLVGAVGAVVALVVLSVCWRRACGASDDDDDGVGLRGSRRSLSRSLSKGLGMNKSIDVVDYQRKRQASLRNANAALSDDDGGASDSEDRAVDKELRHQQRRINGLPSDTDTSDADTSSESSAAGSSSDDSLYHH